MPEFSPLQFRNTLLKRPENLFVFPVSILRDNLEFHLSTETRAAIMAELFIRLFLSNNLDSEEASLIRVQLPDVDLKGFLALFIGQSFTQDLLDNELWSAKDDFSSCCEAAVRQRLRRLFTADGLIPVFLEDGSGTAYLIPFSFKERKEGCAGVFCLNGEEIPEWTECAARLGITQPVELHYHSTHDLSLTGSSLMLPLLMAWRRKQGTLPPYNVFRLVATGKFDGDMKLASVQAEEKAQAAFKQLHAPIFVLPESTSHNPGASQHNRNIHTLPCGIDPENLLGRLLAIVEPIAKIDLRYAMKRLEPMGKEVYRYNFKDWSALIERLEKQDVFDKRRNPDAYLTNLMLRSAACCHAGRTDDSEKLNKKARDFACQHGDKYVKLLLRLEIENLVTETDNGRVENAVALGNQLTERLDLLQDTDLWMRFHGTLGQAIMYGTLLQAPGFSKETAKSHLDDALDCAYQLDSDPEIAHDLNYQHLFYALFDPGSDDELDAFLEAQKQYNRLMDEAQTEDDRRNATRNLFYLKRQQALAWYRILLSSGRPPQYMIDHDFDKLLLDTTWGADDWIRCCVAKCFGALEAANGRLDSAENYFRKAITAIAPEKSPGVISQIHLAALCEAFRTLHKEDYRQKALALLGTAPSLLDGQPTSPDPRITQLFKDFLDGIKPFPGLFFWY